MKEIKLKKCPCCGGEAEMKETRYIDATPSSVKVLCKKCALQTKSFIESLDYCAKEEAAKVWNRRKNSEVCDKCGSDNIEEVKIFEGGRIVEEFKRCVKCGRIIDEK
ncbi:MAG: Lar family restriction alleviation protein [Acutalibacteraceae bacterium]